MKYCYLVLCVCLLSCTHYQGVPEKYHTLLDRAFSTAGENAGKLKNLLDSCDQEKKEGMAFLIAYMPEHDLKSIAPEILQENVDYAYKAKNEFVWSKILPDSIFMNDVLPYVCMNETRENWRKEFYTRFSKYVINCQTIQQAIDSINRNIRNELIVDYNTKREKPDQSPSESIRQGMASCSGLSILLTNAFRAVGIPSRIAGTPNWFDNRGNHNWCEVWADGQWYFTEYYPNRLNMSWFLADAGKADKNDRQHAIYATSYKPTDINFPLVWDENIDYVHAENVTERYVEIYNTHVSAIKGDGNHVSVKLLMFKNNQCTFNSDDRVVANVDIFCGAEQMGGGSTAGPEKDMNDVLEFILEKNKTYTFKYADIQGTPKAVDIKVEDEPLEVKLYMN